MTKEEFNELEKFMEVYYNGYVYQILKIRNESVDLINEDGVEYGVHYSLLENI